MLALAANEHNSMSGAHTHNTTTESDNEKLSPVKDRPPLRRHRTECNRSTDPPAFALRRHRSAQQVAHPCEHADHCVSTCEGYGRVCPASARVASRTAHLAVGRLCVGSSIFAPPITADGSVETNGQQLGCASVNLEDLDIGDILGRGGFSEVRVATMKVNRVCSKTKEGKDDAIPVVKVLPANHTSASVSKGENQYAFKALSRRVMVNANSFKRGAADLAIEAQFLSALQHPHIIKLHGVAAEGAEAGFASGRAGGFFLLIDRLYVTLEQRISTWRDLSAKYNGMFYRASHDLRGCKRRAMLIERLRDAADLADAVRYLHSQKIVYRDLKPDNVGYDSQGVLKLFDFGLAKELKSRRRNCKGTYNLSGNTGSKRYMAPEVALYKPYDERVDAYSFGVVLYEISSMEKPFKDWTAGKHKEEVVEGRFRPKIEHPHGIHSFWPAPLVDLINVCWAHNMSRRPDFDLITQVLDKLCGNIQGKEGQVRGIGKTGSFASNGSSGDNSDSSNSRGGFRTKLAQKMRQAACLKKSRNQESARMA
uniref:Protein kinase domain-containing protein n=1 Tax=Helicotheca tamesis TaxID=374047 RepID=A0A7S2H492_9STRA|mmetsp:Transcript_15144/g.20639  ORF Transcript_15144/g.20639 Transcript_15144/m.20639 type:complete len:538 (+) Transcript_15144:61-1674(+)